MSDLTNIQNMNLVKTIYEVVDQKEGNSCATGEEINKIKQALKSLSIANPLHVSVAKKLNISLVKNILAGNPASANPKRIKYKSKIDTENLDKLVNLSIWKNIPTTNLFNVYESKKNHLVKKIDSRAETSNSPADFGNNNFTNNRFYGNTKKKSVTSEDEDDGGYAQTNTYMNNSFYLKRKNNNTSSSDSENFSNYSNSIYNVNKKKNNNNKNKYKWNKKKDDEEIEEEEEEAGFKPALNLINKKVFKNTEERGYKHREESEPRSSSNQSNNISNNGTKKFNPPYKGSNNSNSNNSNSNNNSNFSSGSNYSNNTSSNSNISNRKMKGEKDEEKEKELDEKLKGFDKKMIEFIESEILSFSPNVKWEHIAGLEFAKKTIKEIIIWPLLRPDIFHGIRRPPKGLLLFGPPGTGKTMIAKAIASESQSKFFNISASSLMSKWIGESEKLVRTLFALASYYQPSVVFIDEIDSILTARSENECEASRRLKTEFLIQLDGAGTNPDDRILIIGATNRPQEIDDAFIRRLAKRLYIPLPNSTSRLQLLNNVIEKEKHNYECDEESLISIVARTKGYSGSDMMSVLREAAMMPIRNIEDIHNVNLDNLRKVNLKDFNDAVDVVKPSVSDKTITQYVQWNKDFGSFQFEEKENDN